MDRMARASMTEPDRDKLLIVVSGPIAARQGASESLGRDDFARTIPYDGSVEFLGRSSQGPFEPHTPDMRGANPGRCQ